MTSLNQVVLLGRLGKDPEVLKTSKAGSFVRLSVATRKKYRNAKGKIEEITQWHTVYFSNKQGDLVASYLKKGSRVHITGELRNNEWEDKKTGERRFSTDIHALNLIFLDAKPENGRTPAPDGSPANDDDVYADHCPAQAADEFAAVS